LEEKKINKFVNAPVKVWRKRKSISL